ncbi:DUF6232 family protein [Kitasatospora sp. NPDC048545]|uniref:DUF6232 family protein n=1 Tax=Kitasatospora sp. NPDC048545 TaxID=3157208 RepID=UPI0033C3E62A
MTKRILWVGEAAYPLATVARASITIIVPDKFGAIGRLFKFAGTVITAAFLLSAVNGAAAGALGGGQQSSDSGWPVVLALVAVVLYFVFVTLPVLRQNRLYALTVDTAGPPTALLAWESPGPAYELQAAVARAIENPQIEFQQFVSSIIVDLRHYQFGDSVNIYGGNGNTGVSK